MPLGVAVISLVMVLLGCLGCSSTVASDPCLQVHKSEALLTSDYYPNEGVKWLTVSNHIVAHTNCYDPAAVARAKTIIQLTGR